MTKITNVYNEINKVYLTNTKKNMNKLSLDIYNTLIASSHLSFYKIMKYPIPKNFLDFLYNYNIDTHNTTNKNNKFSRHHKDKLIESYTKHIHKYNFIYKSIPFIQSIFLCNSITFNGLHKESDIDLFIITKKNSLRRARFFSVLFFLLTGNKRRLKNKKMKFCLSFYITEEHLNLYNISLKQSDIYLAYRIAHLVPLYNSTQHNIPNIFKANKRIHSMLPNHPKTYNINIGTNNLYGATYIKKIFEFILGGPIGILIENIIKYIRLPIVIIKKKHLPNGGKYIIINDNMLKFHKDIRHKVHLLFNTYNQKN